jgi:uncharacterized protein YndB with AHSA1/START domain
VNEASTADAIIREIVINAPAERVFAALTDPQQRIKWWGAPGKFQVTEMDSDLRPGGAWAIRGTGPGAAAFSMSGEYRRVDRPHLLEMTWQMADRPDEPVTLVRFDLTEAAGATTVRLTHSGFTSDAVRERYQGWPWLLMLLKGHAEGATAA